jgi:hypothetical protein
MRPAEGSEIVAMNILVSIALARRFEEEGP